MKKYVSKLKLDGRNNSSVAGFFDIGDGKNMQMNLISSMGLRGELHSQHLYLAAKCISYVDEEENKELLDNIISHLLNEFTLEISWPKAAIEAFGHIGNKAIPYLIRYIKETPIDKTYSREDAALALGEIGTDEVVSQLTISLQEADYEDKAIPLYALGRTRNPKAKEVIVNFLKHNPFHPKSWVAKEALNAF